MIMNIQISLNETIRLVVVGAVVLVKSLTDLRSFALAVMERENKIWKPIESTQSFRARKRKKRKSELNAVSAILRIFFFYSHLFDFIIIRA